MINSSKMNQIQENAMSRRQMQTKKSTELPDNRIGGDYPIVADELYDLGLKWVRTAFGRGIRHSIGTE